MPKWLRNLLKKHGFLINGREAVKSRVDLPEFGICVDFIKRENDRFEFGFDIGLGVRLGGEVNIIFIDIDLSWSSPMWTRSGHPISSFYIENPNDVLWTGLDEDLFTRVFEQDFLPWADRWTHPDWLIQSYLYRAGRPAAPEVKMEMERYGIQPVMAGQINVGLAYLYACRQDWDKAMFWSEGMKHLLTNLRQEVAERRFRPIPIEDAALALGYKRISSGKSAKYEDTPSLFPFSHLLVNGRDAQKEWATRLGIEGMTPVIMGGIDDLELLCRLIDESEQSPEQIIEDAGRIDIEAWFGGCKNFCVNGPPAGNCRIARSDDDRTEARRTR